MRGLEMVKEWIRPFVDSKAWDYCVIWKLGDDPSRFIEWVGCCCSGGANGNNIKVERRQEDEEYQLGALCRDEHIQHPTRTKACEDLSHFPLFMPLYSGIHGEVVMSNVPRWLLNHQGSGFHLKPSNETAGTRVLVPVFDGLIELFSLKTIPADQKMVDLIVSNCNARLMFDPMPGQNQHKSSTPLSRGQQYLVTNSAEQSDSTGLNLSFDGSSSASNPSNGNPSPIQNPGPFFEEFPLNRSDLDSCGSKRPGCKEVSLNQEQTSLVFDYGNNDIVIARENGNKANRKPGGKNCQSKNLVTERNRRNRINRGIFALRSLVPKISKMDKASTLSDAIDYIGELKREAEQLEIELKEMDEMENKQNVAEEKFVNVSGIHQMSASAKDQNRTSRLNQKEKIEVNLEVSQIGKRGFLIRVLCSYKRGGFERLMEAIDSLGLEIAEANVTTFNSSVLNVLNVKVSKDGIQAEALRNLLLVKITSQDSL